MISCVHSHSTFCDGENTMAEMAKAAYELGIKHFGFSGHSYFPAEDFGMKPSVIPEYIATAKKIKELYLGKMDILCGIEVDETIPEDYPLREFDYKIGSSHAVKSTDGNYYMVDHSPKVFIEGIEKGFNNDPLYYAEEYYKQLCNFVKRIKPDIVGHFDLLCKFNAGNKYFNEESKKYRDVALNAVDELLKEDFVFEVNTGGMSRGYIDRPYPDTYLLKRILEKNGRVIVTTDTHSVKTIDYYAQEAQKLVKAIGFTSIWNLTKNGFIETKI